MDALYDGHVAKVLTSSRKCPPAHQFVRSWEQVQTSGSSQLCTICVRAKFTGTPSKRNKEIAGRPAKLLYNRRKNKKNKKWRGYSDGGKYTHTHTHVDGRERASRLSLLRIIEASKNRLALEVLADCTVYRVKGVQSTNVTCISQSHSRRLIENGERRRQQRDESTRRNVQSFNTSKMRVNQFGRFNKSWQKKRSSYTSHDPLLPLSTWLEYIWKNCKSYTRTIQ